MASGKTSSFLKPFRLLVLFSTSPTFTTTEGGLALPQSMGDLGVQQWRGGLGMQEYRVQGRCVGATVSGPVAPDTRLLGEQEPLGLRGLVDRCAPWGQKDQVGPTWDFSASGSLGFCTGGFCGMTRDHVPRGEGWTFRRKD